MPAGLNHTPALSLATRGLLAGRWEVSFNSRIKLARPLHSRTRRFNAPSKGTTATTTIVSPAAFGISAAETVANRLYSSIADAMLGRAVKEAPPPPPPPLEVSKTNMIASEKHVFAQNPPGQNGNISQHFSRSGRGGSASGGSGGRQPSKSLGGFTGYTNKVNPSTTQYSQLGNQNQHRKRNFEPMPSFQSAVASTASTTGLHSVFSRQSSFANTPDTIDLTEDRSKKYEAFLSQQHVVFDENDFEDDADLDIDAEYELPRSMPAPPKYAQEKPTSESMLPPNKPPNRSAPLNHPSSSAQTWSSSPPSHKATPPGAVARREREVQAAVELSQPPHAGLPKKRRTIPWEQNKAEDDELSSVTEEGDEERQVSNSVSTTQKRCFRCNKDDHYSQNCPDRGRGRGTVHDFTPLPKHKEMPWNTTGSAVSNQKKQFKDKQKRKLNNTGMEAGESHRRKKLAMAPLTLSEEQQSVLDLVVGQQKSVFFTGSAGTGKSVLMRAIIAELRKKHLREPDRVAVTASTGLAACNIGGVTLHSFGGIGLGKEDVNTLVKKIKRNPKAKTRWLKTKILIIDEISMVDGDLFDKLEGIARMMRNNGRPFGGIQLVITGDFFQLPPVPDYDNKARGVKFAFDAGTWSTAIHHTIGLTEVFRQKDPVFANMLNEMRLGKITDTTVKAFRALSRKPTFEDALDATELFPTRNEVDNSNAFRMRALAGKSYTFDAIDSGAITDLSMRDKLLANMMAPKTLSLKKGAQVMLIKNMDDGLVNGSLGKIVAFMSEKTFEIYDANPDVLDDSIPTEDLGEDEQKQRSTIKTAESPFAGSKLYPLVRFSIADGTSRDLLVLPEEWKVELPSGEIQAQRSQLPLILAWALSIHKAQGQTLDRVKIDLKKIFEKGQAYVALSRATSQAGLEVQNFDKSKVMAHPRVAQFYDSLYSVNKALQYPKIAELPTRVKKQQPEEHDRARVMGSKVGHGRAFDFDEEEEVMAAYG